MTTIHRFFKEKLNDLPRLAIAALIERKLKTNKIKIPLAAKEALIDHILKGNNDSFTWDVGKRNAKKHHIELSFDETDVEYIDELLVKLPAKLSEIVKKVIKNSAKDFLHELKERWINEGVHQYKETEGFKNRLQNRWGEGLDLLRMLLTISRELAEDIHRRHRRSRSKTHIHRRFVLKRLHIRACQVTDEIITLLENGFADGAMARWRTLYEISVIAILIEQGDENLAQRYIDHNVVDVKKQYDDYDTLQVPLGYAPISKRYRMPIDKNYNKLYNKYGADFCKPYGWIAFQLGKRVTFQDLQEAANKKSMNSYYKLASFNVHADSRAMFLRMTNLNYDLPISGRSNSGLLEPGKRTAFTLVQITASLVGLVKTIDDIIEMETILLLRDSIPKALEKADRKLRRDEMNIRKSKKNFR